MDLGLVCPAVVRGYLAAERAGRRPLQVRCRVAAAGLGSTAYVHVDLQHFKAVREGSWSRSVQIDLWHRKVARDAPTLPSYGRHAVEISNSKRGGVLRWSNFETLPLWCTAFRLLLNPFQNYFWRTKYGAEARAAGTHRTNGPALL